MPASDIEPVAIDPPPSPPAFNPLDPASLAFYISAVLTVVGFVLHRNLSDYAGPVALGVTAVTGIAISVVHAIKYHTWTQVTMHYVSLQYQERVRVQRDRVTVTTRGAVRL